MIIQSNLHIDKRRGTATLGHCCETTINGKMLSLDDIARCLVWHSPLRFAPYGSVMAMVREEAAKISATGVRVSDLTSTLFALGLYTKTANDWGNPNAVVLVQLDRKGRLVKSEVLGDEGSELSAQFHAHKNDPRTADDLRALIISWTYTELLDELMQKHPQPRPAAKTQAPRGNNNAAPRHLRPPAAEANPPKQGKPGKRPIKPQYFQKRPTRGERLELQPGMGKTTEAANQSEPKKEAA